MRRNVHDYSGEHTHCPDTNCCDCECRTCKRAWFDGGRPNPAGCTLHRRDQDDPEAMRKTALSTVDRRKR